MFQLEKLKNVANFNEEKQKGTVSREDYHQVSCDQQVFNTNIKDQSVLFTKNIFLYNYGLLVLHDK